MKYAALAVLTLAADAAAIGTAAAQPRLDWRRQLDASRQLDAPRPRDALGLRGGASKAAQVAQRRLPKAVDSLLAGAGLAGTLALMGALELRLGLKLFAPPMMASGIIFFSGSAPPNPKGFLSGTLGCGTASYVLMRALSGLVSPVAAQGCAAGALLVWYKSTACTFPPAAVLAVLMSNAVAGGATPLSFVLQPWLAGHTCLYASALAVSQLRAATALRLARHSFSALSTAELRKAFNELDISRDGTLDANELKIALRTAIALDLPMSSCSRLIGSADKDGSGTIDFKEFEAICRAKSRDA